MLAGKQPWEELAGGQLVSWEGSSPKQGWLQSLGIQTFPVTGEVRTGCCGRVGLILTASRA